MNSITKLLILSALVVTVGACASHHHDEGPIERAGRHVDNAWQGTRDAAIDVGRNVRDTGHDIKRDYKRDND